MSTTNRSGNSSRTTSGRSRAQGQSRGKQSAARYETSRQIGSSATSRQTSSGTTARRTAVSGSTSQRRRNTRRRRKNTPNYALIAVIGVILIIAIISIVYGMKSSDKKETKTVATTAAEIEETELVKDVKVDGITITGMSRDAAKQEILKNYPWAMKARYQEDTYEVANLMADKVDALLEEIYSGEPKEEYTLDTSGLEDAVAAQVEVMKLRWNKAAKNGSISSYDAASDSFIFAGEETGVAIDEAKLTSDMMTAISAKDFDAEITVSASAVQPEITAAAAKEKYTTIGKYTTKTTANKKRNTNVRLAAEALNGAIVGPGQELSFNDTVGERTAAKGYQGAAAYNNGEVVEEIGGGVCQVSTTLYNAVLRAGMKISVRRSHTFEPSYVTPGQDATVSWGGPDFKFINTSSAAVGIRASYADQTMTVSVYGIPVLEDGVTYSLESAKIEDLGYPEPTYVEDQTLQLDEEVVDSQGSTGSRWQTKLIVKKNGEIISQEVDHTTTYKGHAPVVRRNTSGVVIPDPSASSESAEGQGGDTTAAGVTPVSPVEGEEGGPSISGQENSSGSTGSQTQTTTPTDSAPTAGTPVENVPSDNTPVTAPVQSQDMPGEVSPVTSDQPGGSSDQFVAPKPED